MWIETDPDTDDELDSIVRENVESDQGIGSSYHKKLS